MENFIYSINATLPVFLVMVIGYLLKQKGMITDEFVTVSNKFNFNVTLPALLLQDIASANISEVFDLKYLLFCMIVTTICFFSMWGITKLLMKDKSMTGAFVQASFRGSAAVLGVAFIQNMYGNSGMAPLMIVGAVPLYNIYSVIVLTFESNSKNEKSMKSAFINICKNPIILSILAGIILSLTGVYIKCPKIITKTVGNIAALATPLALIAIGAGLDLKQALKKLKPAFIATFVKLILQVAIFLPVAYYLGFRDEKMIAILIMLGAPTTASCYIMAKNMDNDDVLTSSVVVLTTLFSALSLTFWIFLLKTIHAI